MKKTALVLAGGGSRGAYEIGVWKALRDMDIPIHIVTGTSIGSINGAMVAMGDYEQACKMWNTITTSQIFEVPVEEEEEMRKKIIKTYSTFAKDFFHGGTDTKPLKDTLEKYFDEKKIRESKIEYGLVTVEMEGLKPVEIFAQDIPKGKLVDFILASCSIYPAVKPYVIDGKKYIDGTYHDNLPIAMALKKGAKRIIAVDLDAFGKVNKELLESLDDVIYIKSYWDLGISLVFDQIEIKRIKRLGYLDCMKHFGVYDGYAYTFIKNTGKEINSSYKRDGKIANQLGIYSGKKKFTISDKLLEGKWDKIAKERKLSSDKGDDILCVAELAGEILELDPKFIYSEERFNDRLKEELKKIDLSGYEIILDGKITGDERKLLLDEKKRVKYFSLEIAHAIKTGEELEAARLASIYTKEFFAALYISIKGLI